MVCSFLAVRIHPPPPSASPSVGRRRTSLACDDPPKSKPILRSGHACQAMEGSRSHRYEVTTPDNLDQDAVLLKCIPSVRCGFDGDVGPQSPNKLAEVAKNDIGVADVAAREHRHVSKARWRSKPSARRVRSVSGFDVVQRTEDS